MSAKGNSIQSKSMWTIGTYIASSAIRFSSNIVLSRVLAPEILGIVVIAQAVRVGTDLLSDVGLQQNVVHSRDGDSEPFLNTIWTIQVIRGLLITLVCCALSPALAGFYDIDTSILIAVSFAPLVGGLMSTGLYSLSRQLEVKKRNLFDLASETIGLLVTVALAFALRNVWAPIIGILASIAIRSAMTYALPHPRHRFRLDRAHAWEIFHFSKWIMLSSLAFYAAVYIDRLYLGRVVPLAMLGIYGLARAISDLPQAVSGRLAFQIVFPFISGQRDAMDDASRRELSRTRLLFLLLVAGGIGTVIGWSDWAVKLLYGPRYLAAGWMLSILLVGSWIGVVAQLNEAVVFGGGKPKLVSVANMVRIAVMMTLLPAGFALGGLPVALFALPLGELARAAILFFAQRRIGITFLAQDMLLSAGMIIIVFGWMAVRSALALGMPWSGAI